MAHPRLTQRMLDVGNASYRAKLDAQLASEIRAFRPQAVANLSDKQLSFVVKRSREAAYSFGVRDPDVIRHWVKVEAILAPGFFAMPKVANHFAHAFGDADTKARDVIQLIKVTFKESGRKAEVWR